MALSRAITSVLSQGVAEVLHSFVCFKEPFGHSGVFGQVERLEVLNAAMAGWLSPIHDPFPLSSWTFLWLPRWTSVVGQEGLCSSRTTMRTTKEKAVALYGKRQKLNHVMSGKVDTLECISCPGSIQLGNFISYLFCKSAGKKSKYFFKCNRTLLYGHCTAPEMIPTPKWSPFLFTSTPKWSPINSWNGMVFRHGIITNLLQRLRSQIAFNISLQFMWFFSAFVI